MRAWTRQHTARTIRRGEMEPTTVLVRRYNISPTPLSSTLFPAHLPLFFYKTSIRKNKVTYGKIKKSSQQQYWYDVTAFLPSFFSPSPFATFQRISPPFLQNLNEREQGDVRQEQKEKKWNQQQAVHRYTRAHAERFTFDDIFFVPVG